jgi:hypothetical protein
MQRGCSTTSCGSLRYYGFSSGAPVALRAGTEAVRRFVSCPENGNTAWIVVRVSDYEGCAQFIVVTFVAWESERQWLQVMRNEGGLFARFG